MMTLLKVILVTGLAAIGLCGFGVVAVAGYLFSGGVAAVEVDTPEVDLNIPVPLRLFDLGLGVAGFAAPDDELRQVRSELEPWQPLLYDLADEIHRLPEGEIVRVKTDSELVLITHEKGRIGIEVDSEDAHIKVSAPRHAIGRIFNKSVRLATP